MQTYEILVRNRSVVGNSDDMSLVRTSVGIDQVHVLFDNAEWLEFPVTITFAQGNVAISQTLVTGEVDGSSEWVADAYVTVPHEVIRMVGPIRVTLQGIDSQGRHIITAKGSPLSVEESGDVTMGEIPSDAPTVDQWNQAYADAMSVANRARSIEETLESNLDALVESASLALDERIDGLITPATSERLGSVMVGDGLTVDQSGLLSLSTPVGMTNEQKSVLANLALLAQYAFVTEFDGSGTLRDNVVARRSALPIASASSVGCVSPDGTTVTIDEDGTLHSWGVSHSWDGSVLTISSSSGTSSADLIGPSVNITEATATVDDSVGNPSVSVTMGGTAHDRTIGFSFSGLKGERGERGPSGYVLTDDDIEEISEAILARYVVLDGTRF